MECTYDNLLAFQRPSHMDDDFIHRHPRMERLNRAKLFAPFAALSGFDAEVRTKEVPYVPRHILDADETWALNHALLLLWKATRTRALAQQNRMAASVEYFVVCDDPHHDGCGRLGLYHRATGVVQRVDPVAQCLTISGICIPFSDIDAITDPMGHPLRECAAH